MEQRILLSPENTSYGRLKVELLSIEPSSQTDPVQARDERIYFVLDGKGTFDIEWLRGHWRSPIRADTTIWIPSLRHQIRNCADSTLRCLVFACRTEEEMNERYMFTEVTDARTRPSKSYIGGSEVFIFTPGELWTKSKFNFCGCATFHPSNGSDPHVPTDDCEETIYVTRGEGEIMVGDQKHPVQPGSLAYIPRGTMHCEQNLGQELLEVFIVENHD